MPTREDIFACNDTVVEPVHVKEWKMDLFVRSLSASEKAKWEFSAIDVATSPKQNEAATKLVKTRLETARERLVEFATCNQDGSRFFKDGDASQLGHKNANAISTLYDAAARLSGISREDLEEITKNSEADQSAGSTSA